MKRGKTEYMRYYMRKYTKTKRGKYIFAKAQAKYWVKQMQKLAWW